MLQEFKPLPGGLARLEIYCENDEEYDQMQALYPPELGKSVIQKSTWKGRKVVVESVLLDKKIAEELATNSAATPKGQTDYAKLPVPRLREIAAERGLAGTTEKTITALIAELRDLDGKA